MFVQRLPRRAACGLWLIAVVAVTSPLGAGRPLFTTAFPPEEFAAHRAAVFAQIGDGLAVLQGAAELPSYLRFRQGNQFFYLSGVEVPRAMLLLDGRAKTATLFLQPRNEVMERSEGPVLVPDADAARLTAIADVRPRDDFAAAFKAAAAAGRTVYTPMRGESLAAVTPDAVGRHAAAVAADPWDGQPSREAAFVEKLKAAAPGIEVKDLDPVLDALRVIKTPREVAAIREATRLAGLAMLEAMRAARPGMREHEKYKAAAEEFVTGFRRNTRNSLGHFVGMEVHDVTTTVEVLAPGMVFTIEPQLKVPDERAYVRLEDVILVTPSGYENLSAFVPYDMEGVEKVMAEPSRFDAQSAQGTASR